jgi:fibro-slime domain-containing protein
MAKKESKKIVRRKHLTRVVSQVTLFVAFFGLLFEGIVAAAYGMSVVAIDQKGGVPANWVAHTAELPDTIAIPATYYDQLSEACPSQWNTTTQATRQFEFSRCGGTTYGLQQGLVKESLGEDSLPVPSYAVRNTNLVVTSQGVLGNDPVLESDNFYRWFHEVDGKSKEVVGRSLTFKKVGDGIYQYGGGAVFPLDDVDFSRGDYNANRGHNYHFTMMMSVPFYVAAGGDEYFEFEGDDDVWVFVNGKLILDIGGVHEIIKGNFKINDDATITSTVNGKTKVIDAGLKDGMATKIDFFYAERNTTEANCKITIRGMLSPISAEPTVRANMTEDGLIEYTAALRNKNPSESVKVEDIASFLNNGEDLGFLRLSADNLAYTMTPSNTASWQMLDINMPAADSDGFKVNEEITLAPYGQSGDTLYLHFYVKPTKPQETMNNTVSFVVSNGNSQAIVSAAVPISYEVTIDEVEGDENETGPIVPPDENWSDDLDEDLEVGYKDPLGEIYVVDGTTNGSPSGLFSPRTGSADFAAVIMSQMYLLINLGIFAVSFAVFWPVHNY